MINTIRRFLIKIDPTLKPTKVSENLLQPLNPPEIYEFTSRADGDTRPNQSNQ